MPKNARIDAYLESMSSQTENEPSNSPNASAEYSGGLSDDSLDALPASYSNGWNNRNAMDQMSESVHFGQNELLQQLKQRLKKTKSESPVTAVPRFPETKKICTERAQQPSSVKTDAKLKKV
ncbi:unnamed protein product [Gongylonema pulchrum]|uniref:Uncharacterized protein n=1 Tax=Gongylonema pulchrum TaxID=637853 RepID=A0A183DC78_9BILA|nr:unnamed protein product [Gongylonema pulchrum]